VEPRLLTYFASMSVVASWLWLDEESKNGRGNNLLGEVAHAPKLNPLSDLDKILKGGRYIADVIIRANFGGDRFTGGEAQILPFPIGFRRRP